MESIANSSWSRTAWEAIWSSRPSIWTGECRAAGRARAAVESGAAAEDAAAQYILERTSLVYFFANQVPLLELANMRGPDAAGLAPGGVDAGNASSAFNMLMMRWKNLRETFAKRRSGGEEFNAKLHR